MSHLWSTPLPLQQRLTKALALENHLQQAKELKELLLLAKSLPCQEQENRQEDKGESCESVEDSINDDNNDGEDGNHGDVQNNCLLR